MKNINIKLSDSSINAAIRKLSRIKDDLRYSVNDIVETLAHNGAEIAQSAYGSMAKAVMMPVSMTEAKISVIGGDDAIIAEFGAGYATMEYHPFAKNAPVPIRVASYSQAQYPYGLFYITNDLLPGEGYWFFGGVEYDRVQPRHGLLNAYDYIMENSTKIQWAEMPAARPPMVWDRMALPVSSLQ